MVTVETSDRIKSKTPVASRSLGSIVMYGINENTFAVVLNSATTPTERRRIAQNEKRLNPLCEAKHWVSSNLL